MRRNMGGQAMRILWDRNARADDSADWSSDWASTAGDLEDGLPLHSGRALTWLSAMQAIIQVSGILFIIYACLP